MAYDMLIAKRIRVFLEASAIAFDEKKMFGGICFMVDGKLCVGVDKNRLIARVGKEFYQKALALPYCIEFDIRKKPINGYVLVEEKGIENENELSFWIEKSLSSTRKS